VALRSRHLLFGSWLLALFLAAGLAESQATVVLTGLAPPSELSPRQTVSLVVLAENRGDAPWSGRLDPDLPPGWRLLVPPVEMTLAPGESAPQVFTFQVPQNAGAGSYAINVLGEGGIVRAEFRLRVIEQADIDVLLLEAPQLVVDGEYVAVFAVRNEGNVNAALKLSVEDDLGLRLRLELDELLLRPGETREIAVRVEVPADLGRSEDHRLTLRAEGEGAQAQPLVASARSTVDLIPLRADFSVARHTFPLRLRSTAAVSLDKLPAGPAAAVRGAEFELNGEGKLWDRQAGTFSVRLRTGLRGSQRRSILDYRNDRFRVALTSQVIRSMPLFPELLDAGLSAGAELSPADYLRLEAEAFVLSGESGDSVGGSVRFDYEEALRGSVHVVAGEQESHFGTRWQIVPDSGRPPPAGRATEIDVEYALRRKGSGEVGRALWIGAGIETEPLDLSVGMRALEGGYDDRDFDSSTLTSTASYSFGVSFPREVEIRYRLGSEYRLGTMSSGPRVIERQDSRVELGLEGTLAGVDVGLSYAHEHQADHGESSRNWWADDIGVSAGAFLEADTQLQQRLGLRRETGSDIAGARYSYSYSAGMRAPYEGGHLTAEVELDYSREQRFFNRLNLRTEWSGPLTSELELTADGNWGIAGDRVLQLGFETRHRPDRARLLTLGMEANLYRSRSAGLSLRLAYVDAFDVPLGPLSTVGSVSGTVEDSQGRPLSRLVVRLAGRSAVTQEDGSFHFPGVPEGSHQLVVHSDSLARNELTVPASPIPVEVRAGSNARVDFQVVNAARLTGRVSFHVPAVRDSAVVYGIGRPERESELVAGILVELSNGSTTVRGVSDARGRFEFARLPPGEWRLLASAAHLSELYRLEPAEQKLHLESGENLVTIEIRPQARPIRLIEGGLVEDGEGSAPE
jgi:hypothetical protein